MSLNSVCKLSPSMYKFAVTAVFTGKGYLDSPVGTGRAKKGRGRGLARQDS
jgi:hypothetical protein